MRTMEKRPLLEQAGAGQERQPSRAPLADLDYRTSSACGVTGIMDTKGRLMPGDAIFKSICNMTERGNGLGSGYAAYGIYPKYKDQWAFHLMYQNETARGEAEMFLKRRFNIVHMEPIPVTPVATLEFVPNLWRYFMDLKVVVPGEPGFGATDEDRVVEAVMHINKDIADAFVFSSGKNMGIFKGRGFPEEIGNFFRIPEYAAYIWTAHNRFPTNSIGWWGGAHPFGLLDWSLVHNGEISSYGTNRRYLENAGYFCTMSTDTEVMTYLFDMLVRKHGMDFETVSDVMAASVWRKIERLPAGPERERLKALRIIYSSALVTGPFAVIVANTNHMVGLNDRVKLRPLVAAKKGNVHYIASEEAAIRTICASPDDVWMPEAGKPTVVSLEKPRG